jgi:hypothetical protein
MRRGFTTGLQATNRNHKCTLLPLVYLRHICENRDVCEMWERNWKETRKSLTRTRQVLSFLFMVLYAVSNTVSGKEVIWYRCK